MPINRAPFNALVDDDGSNTIGTPWNKQAIKDVLLDPIDALASTPAYPQMTVLRVVSGVSTNPAAENLAVVVLPAVAVTDAVVSRVSCVYSGGSAPLTVDLYLQQGATGYPGITLTDPTVGAGALVPNGVGVFAAETRVVAANTYTIARGTITTGTTQARGFVFGQLAVPDLRTAGVLLYLRQMTGIVAGASLTWTWTVYLVRSGPALLRDAIGDAGLLPADAGA
jgi:hypothetical protein